MVPLGRTSKRVLLTGAGISRNWGGKLASELWSDLIGHSRVQSRDVLRTLLLEEPSFEVAVARCRAESFAAADQQALENALLDAYVSMDHQIADNQYQPYGWIDIYRFQKLLSRFCWTPNRLQTLPICLR